MVTLGQHSDRENSPENALPNRVLHFLEPGTSRLKEYPGEEEIIHYLQILPTPEQDALKEGRILSLYCADGIYECALNTENGNISIAPINSNPPPIHVNFSDDAFPGEENLLGFLQERLTKHYKIGTYLALHFVDKSITYQIGLIPSRAIESVKEGISELVKKSLATNSHPG